MQFETKKYNTVTLTMRIWNALPKHITTKFKSLTAFRKSLLNYYYSLCTWLINRIYPRAFVNKCVLFSFYIIKGPGDFQSVARAYCFKWLAEVLPWRLNRGSPLTSKSSVVRQSEITKGLILFGLGGKGLRKRVRQVRAGFRHVESPGQPLVVEAHPTFKY